MRLTMPAAIMVFCSIFPGSFAAENPRAAGGVPRRVPFQRRIPTPPSSAAQTQRPRESASDADTRDAYRQGKETFIVLFQKQIKVLVSHNFNFDFFRMRADCVLSDDGKRERFKKMFQRHERNMQQKQKASKSSPSPSSSSSAQSSRSPPDALELALGAAGVIKQEAVATQSQDDPADASSPSPSPWPVKKPRKRKAAKSAEQEKEKAAKNKRAANPNPASSPSAAPTYSDSHRFAYPLSPPPSMLAERNHHLAQFGRYCIFLKEDKCYMKMVPLTRRFAFVSEFSAQAHNMVTSRVPPPPPPATGTTTTTPSPPRHRPTPTTPSRGSTNSTSSTSPTTSSTTSTNSSSDTSIQAAATPWERHWRNTGLGTGAATNCRRWRTEEESGAEAETHSDPTLPRPCGTTRFAYTLSR